MLRVVSTSVSALLVLAVGCSDDRRPARDTGMADAGVDAPSVDTGPGVDAGPRVDTGPVSIDAVIWAHSGRELFRFDPNTMRVTSMGDLDTRDEVLEIQDDGRRFFSLTDLAVRSDGAVYGLGRNRVWLIDPERAMATSVVEGVQGVAMTFVPPGEVSSEEELIVGYEDDGTARLARVDLDAGTVENLAFFSGDCEPSGDIASIAGLGTFVTLRCGDDESTDFLARLDVTDASLEMIGPIGVADIWGLGFWAGVFYGFTEPGELVRIDATTGRGTIVSSDTGAEAYWGAGVTVDAPLI